MTGAFAAIDIEPAPGMLVGDLGGPQALSVRERLVWAADDELMEHGTLTGRFEGVAHRAGISRATAYRHIGSVSELLVQVGLRRSQKHIGCVREIMARERGGVLAKIESALIYSARELAGEPVVLALISRQSGGAVEPEVHRITTEVMGPVLLAGQYAGEIRTDVDLECVMDFLTEQTYLATQLHARSEAAVRRRFRIFVAPAIAPPRTELDVGLWDAFPTP